jgi:hypothetical protein
MAMEEQLEQLERDVAQIKRILAVQTVTIRDMLTSRQMGKDTLERVTTVLEQLEKKDERSTH